MTTGEASAVTNIGNAFKYDTQPSGFREFQYFTSVTTLRASQMTCYGQGVNGGSYYFRFHSPLICPVSCATFEGDSLGRWRNKVTILASKPKFSRTASYCEFGADFYFPNVLSPADINFSDLFFTTPKNVVVHVPNTPEWLAYTPPTSGVASKVPVSVDIVR